MKRFLLSLPLLCLPLATMADKTPAEYVNTFIGTAATGHTFPGACAPFGMVQASPVTGAWGWQYCTQYIYTDAEIWGFTQTNLNGTGCTDLGDILLMPVEAAQVHAAADKTAHGLRSPFRKETEAATPGFYTVYLDKPQARAEISATPHVAYHRYTFTQPDSAAVYVDFQHHPTWTEQQYHACVKACEVQKEDSTTVSGHLNAQVWVNKDVYFTISFSRPFTRAEQLPAQAAEERGSRWLFHFDLQAGESVDVKVALSSVSVLGSRRNLMAECPDWDFEGVISDTHRAWNDLLSRFSIDGTEEEKTNFYTSFYHLLIQPNNIADADGLYRLADGQVRQALDDIPASQRQAACGESQTACTSGETACTDGQKACTSGGKAKKCCRKAALDRSFFSTFSCWDTYRAAHPLYTLVMPEMVDPFVRSLISQGEVQGHLPIWALWGKENYCMIGNHSVSIVAEAYHKGFRGFDVARAWKMVRQTQTQSHREKTDWETYEKYGYYPYDLIPSENVSSTLENVYDDYAAWDMASLLGYKEDAARFAKRRDFYKNLFDKETLFMRPRKSDGTWRTPFNPSALAHAESSGGDYTEGNAWQYTWHVQHDVPGLIKIFGGRKPFLAKLDQFFTTHLESTLSDVTGLIGQYAHGNEPSHHVAYLYALAGRPERTQELVREIVRTQYQPRPDGLCGNDDCGQMSAWYILSCMGFYPVDPVSGQYVLGAPQLPRIEMQLPSGKTFTVVAEGLSDANVHVRAVYLNGKRLKRGYITQDEICAGGTLRFVMSSEF